MKKKIAILVVAFSALLICAVLATPTPILAILVAVEASDRTLIIVAVITMLGTVFTGIMTFIGARISAGNRTGLAELSKGIDGVAHELKAATAEGTVAKVEAARAMGQLEERKAETARQGAAALAQQGSGTPATTLTAPTTPIPVVVENTEDNKVRVKL